MLSLNEVFYEEPKAIRPMKGRSKARGARETLNLELTVEVKVDRTLYFERARIIPRNRPPRPCISWLSSWRTTCVLITGQPTSARSSLLFICPHKGPVQKNPNPGSASRLGHLEVFQVELVGYTLSQKCQPY